VSVLETTLLMAADFNYLLNRVTNGQVVLWLGSGISLGRADGLGVMIERVLEFVRVRSNPGDPKCKYARALFEMVDLADLSPQELESVSLSTPVSTWSVRESLVRRLSGKYSLMLDTRIVGHDDDFLVWEGVDVTNNFPDSLEPDVEHIALSILILEGVIPHLVTANWDGLVEKAVARLTEDAGSRLRVLIRASDYRVSNSAAQLYKFHGCAIRAFEDPDSYRELLIARDTQIVAWGTDPNVDVARRELTSLAYKFDTLMIGLSAQDHDIRFVFASAASGGASNWPGGGPSIVFAEDKIGDGQLSILKGMYKGGFTPNATEIVEKSLLRAYAKQSLTALVLLVWWKKLSALAGRLDIEDIDQWQEDSSAGLAALRGLVAEESDTASVDFIDKLWAGASALHHYFLTGTIQNGPARYLPLTGGIVDQILIDAVYLSSGHPEWASGLAVLGHGLLHGAWAIGVNASGGAPIVTLRVGAETRSLHFFANASALAAAEKSGHFDNTDPTVVAVEGRGSERSARSPSAPPGRVGERKAVVISADSTLLNELSIGEMLQRLRQEIVL